MTLVNHDDNGDPYMFHKGDMGTFQNRILGYGAETGTPITSRCRIPGTAKFTGGFGSEGTPTLAMNHPAILPTDIPKPWNWPRSLGPDPR